MLKNRLQLFITNETSTLVTNDNYFALNVRKQDIGKFYYKFPQRFIDGRVFPKKIIVDNIGMYCEDHTIQYGAAAYADFVTESEQLLNCIGFVCIDYKTIEFDYLANKSYSLVWLKDVHGELISHVPDRFIITGWLLF